MALVRWQPSSDFDRLVGSFFGPTAGPARPAYRRWVPAVDLVEAADHYVLTADLPGLKPGDVSIELTDGVLSIAGERTSEHTERRDGAVRIERASGSFRRSVKLPDGVDPEQVAATFADGVLEVSVPKPTERKPHRVQITVGTGETPAADEPAAA